MRQDERIRLAKVKRSLPIQCCQLLSFMEPKVVTIFWAKYFVFFQGASSLSSEAESPVDIKFQVIIQIGSVTRRIFWGDFPVCMFRGCPLWTAHGRRRQTGPGEGLSIVPMSQPHGYHWSRVTHTGWLMAIGQSAFCSPLYSGQLRAIYILMY